MTEALAIVIFTVEFIPIALSSATEAEVTIAGYATTVPRAALCWSTVTGRLTLMKLTQPEAIWVHTDAFSWITDSSTHLITVLIA